MLNVMESKQYCLCCKFSFVLIHYYILFYQQRLGHPLHLRASTMYAKEIADKKEKDQPDKPATAVDVLETIPAAY